MNLVLLHRRNGLLVASFMAFYAFLIVSAVADDLPPLRIGLIVPLTGVTADYGVAIKNSIDLAFEDEPDLNKVMTLVYEDAQYDPKLAVSALSKLRNVDRVDLLFSWGLAQCKVLAPLAEQQKVPLVAQCLETAIAKDRKYVLRFQSSVDDYMAETAAWLAAKNFNRLAILVAENAYTEAVFEGLKRQTNSNQTVTLVNRVPTGFLDFRTEIARLRGGNFDAVGVLLVAGQISTFARQFRELRGARPLFGSNFFGSLSEIQASNGSLEGAVFAEVDVKSEFAARYSARYHNEAQLGFGALAYEFIRSLGKLLRERGRPSSPEEILVWLAQSGRHEGLAAGPYVFGDTPAEGKHVDFPLGMKMVSDGGFANAR